MPNCKDLDNMHNHSERIICSFPWWCQRSHPSRRASASSWSLGNVTSTELGLSKSQYIEEWKNRPLKTWRTRRRRWIKMGERTKSERSFGASIEEHSCWFTKLEYKRTQRTEISDSRTSQKLEDRKLFSSFSEKLAMAWMDNYFLWQHKVE